VQQEIKVSPDTDNDSLVTRCDKALASTWWEVARKFHECFSKNFTHLFNTGSTGVYVCLVISRGPTAEWIMHVLFDPLFLDCHAIGNDLPVDHDELGSVPLNRTCGRSTSAWYQLGNGLRIVNGGSGQWKRLYAPGWGMLLMMMMNSLFTNFNLLPIPVKFSRLIVAIS